MLRNYFIIGFRNLWKHKGYALISVGGLSIGIACCLLILFYVRNEVVYDRYHSKGDRIYRVLSTFSYAGKEDINSGTNYQEAKVYADEIPEIEGYVRFEGGKAVVRNGDDYIEETKLIYADVSIFDLFDFKVIDGTVQGVLDAPSQIVITKDVAIKYFGKTAVTGELLQMDIRSGLESFVIVAVIDNHPHHSSMDFDMVLPWTKLETQLSARSLYSWWNLERVNSFLLLRENARPGIVEKKMRQVRLKHNQGSEPSNKGARNIKNSLQPFGTMHLSATIGRVGTGLSDPNDPVYLSVLTSIGLAILILACINFTNLSIARSLPRSKEVGVRKVLGAHKRQLVFQFLTETFILCTFSFVLGLVLVEIMLPVFESLVGQVFSLNIVDDPTLLLLCGGLLVFTAIIAGGYPSFVASRFNTILSLKGKVKMNGRSTVSKTLLIIQFIVAYGLMVGSLTINSQVKYMVDMDLGYDDSHLIRIHAREAGVDNIAQLLKNELAGYPDIVHVATADKADMITVFTDGENMHEVTFSTTDEDYLNTIGGELLEGRYLRKGEELKTEDAVYSSVVVNEAFLRETGLKGPWPKIVRRYQIVGVVKDFHYQSTKLQIKPLMLVSASNEAAADLEQVYVKYNPGSLLKVYEKLEAAWEKYVPYRPFKSDFVAVTNAGMYVDEMRWRSIIACASVLTTFIAILGLVGLSHLSAQQRAKEIGIRKVLGASLSQIVTFLNRPFSRLMIISVALAFPILYYLIRHWLENFAYQASLSFYLFMVPGLVILLISWLSVGIQSYRVANTDPAISLKHE